MTEQVCGTCGTSNSSSASFCGVCDTFLGWHDEVDPPAPAAEAGAGRGSADAGTDARAAPGAGNGGAGAAGPDGAAAGPGAAAPPRPDRVKPPAVSLEQSEVVVTPVAPGTFSLSIKNDSTIVDSYDIHAVTPPSWLAVTHGDTNLFPDQVRTVEVTLSVRPRTLAVAQRTAVPLYVRSSVDPTQLAEIEVTVVVPKSGPPATLVAHPTLIRLDDVEQGSFGLRFDNQAANHPRHYRVAATDPEGLVMFEFVPPAVDVPAGGVTDSTVRFAAPSPPPGEELSRQLTVTATADDGPVSVQVTVAQTTSPLPERHPVKMRLEPSQLSVVDGATADLYVVVDNRAGHEPADVTLRGRDPARAISFTFDHERFTVPPGRALKTAVHLRSTLPAHGQSVSRPFSVVSVEGESEVEVSGTFELTTRPAAISTARVVLVPDHLVVSSRRGTFAVDLDNRSGAEPLNVVLSGADEFGRARFVFTPAQVAVPPGQVVRTSLVVEHPKPAGGSSATRRVRVTATSGTDSVHGEAVFTQQAQSYRRLWAMVTVVFGALLAVLGLLVYADDPALSGVEAAVRSLVDAANEGSMPPADQIRLVVAVAALLVVLLCVAVILFGLTGTSGKAVRRGAIIAALAGVAATVSSTVVGGIALVLVGAVIAFIGGVLLRSAG